MRPFERKLHEEIEQLESTNTSNSGSHLENAKNANASLREAEATLDGLRQDLAHAIESMNADLAVAVRNLVPKINTTLNGGKCTITYRSRSLDMCPDVDRGKWTVGSSETGKTFQHQYLGFLQLTDDPSELAEAIADYFVGNYKTLQDKNFVTPTEALPEIPPEAPPDLGAPAIKQKGTQEPGTGYFA